MSAVVVPVSTSSSGDEGGLHEDMEDKPLDSAGEEVSPALIRFRINLVLSSCVFLGLAKIRMNQIRSA